MKSDTQPQKEPAFIYSRLIVANVSSVYTSEEGPCLLALIPRAPYRTVPGGVAGHNIYQCRGHHHQGFLPNRTPAYPPWQGSKSEGQSHAIEVVRCKITIFRSSSCSSSARSPYRCAASHRFCRISPASQRHGQPPVAPQGSSRDSCA